MRKKEEGYGTALLREGKIRVWKEERGKNWERKDGKGSTSHFGCLTVSPCCGTRLKEKLAILMNVIAFEEPGRKFERKWEEETLSRPVSPDLLLFYAFYRRLLLFPSLQMAQLQG